MVLDATFVVVVGVSSVSGRESSKLNGLARLACSERISQVQWPKWFSVSSRSLSVSIPGSTDQSGLVFYLTTWWHLGSSWQTTKAAHFLPIKITLTSEQLVDLSIQEMVRLYGVPLNIVSDRGTKFTSKFWNGFQASMGTKLQLSTTFRH